MRTTWSLAAVACFALTGWGGERKLVWSDEFDRDGLPDPAKWGYEEGFVRNRELQYYTKDRKENARVENGHLIIEARKERFPNARFRAGASENRWQQSREFADCSHRRRTSRMVFQSAGVLRSSFDLASKRSIFAGDSGPRAKFRSAPSGGPIAARGGSHLLRCGAADLGGPVRVRPGGDLAGELPAAGGTGVE